MKSAPGLSDIEVITFDCYGTLIDWEAGAFEILRGILNRAGSGMSVRELFDHWEARQFEYLQEPYEPYSEILYHSLLDTLEELRIPHADGDGDRFSRAIGEWKPFPEVPAALGRLKARCRLGIISNIDDEILELTLRWLGVEMDYLVTAEQAGFYKPDPEPFRLALERIGRPAERVLHAAFGYKYDLGPATELGLRTAFVNRAGRSLPQQLQPTLEVTSIEGLADALGA